MADLIERLRAATMGFDWSDLPDDALIPTVPLLREAATALSQEREAREKDREHIRKQAEDIMTLGALVYVNEHETWKDRAASLEAERDDARRQRDEIGRAWDEADARAKEAEARAASLEKALVEAREALKPFGQSLERLGRSRRELDDRENIRGRGCDLAITMGDLRRAAALSSSKQKDGGE